MSYSGIKLNIATYQRENHITKYGIEVKCGKQEWKIFKRYSEIEEIHHKLSELFSDLPNFPKKQLFHLNLSEIEFRKDQLNNYINQLITRREIVNSLIFRDFLILDQYDQFLTPVQTQHKVLNMSVKDMHENDNLTLALLYDSSLICRMDTYMNNILDSTKQAPTSSIIAFQLNDYKNKLFSKEFKNSAVCMNFNNSENAFAVGFSNGALNYYKLDNQNFLIDMEEQFQISQNKINGCVVVNRNIFAITSNQMKIQNTKKIEEVSEITVGNQELNCIIYNSERSIIVMANCIGDIFICQVPFIKIDLKVKTDTPMIKSLLIDNEKNYLMFMNFDASHLQILDFGKGLQNGFAPVKTKIQVRNKSLCFEWSKKRGELYIGNEDGTVSVWNAIDLAPFYIFKAHSKCINRILWNESKQLLLTGSDDEIIKQWFLPKKWRVSQEENFSTF